MAIFNFNLGLNAYSDSKSTNAPSLNNFKWNRDITGIAVDNPDSLSSSVAANTTKSIFSSTNKRMVYIEVSASADLIVNGASAITISPVVQGTSIYPGVWLTTQNVTSLSIKNNSLTDTVSIYVVSIE
jgi:hypothetical protein